MMSPGHCSCDNPLINELATDIIEALPVIASVSCNHPKHARADMISQIGCSILMSALDVVIQVGASAIPAIGEGIDAGMSMS